jgi:excisionase family DNA binding protein
MTAKLLTAEQVARRLNVTKHTVWKWIREGRLRATRFGGRAYRINEEDLLMSQTGRQPNVRAWAREVEALKRAIAERGGQQQDSTPLVRREREGQ